MKSRWLIAILLGCGLIAGVVAAQIFCSSIPFRSAFGRFFGRGELIALVHGEGVYEGDLTGGGPVDMDAIGLIAEKAIAFQARSEKISSSQIDQQYDVLASQLRDENAWTEALHANRLCAWMFRRRIARNLRSQQWIEKQLNEQSRPSPAECRAYFDNHADAFHQPPRFRAAHLFLAAPPETPEDVVDVKRRTIAELLTRLDRGEKFSDLVAAFSEDEATKEKKGDLGYFSDFRMPEDFMAAVRGLHIGETSRAVQTALGFHIIQLTDSKPAREMTFEEALPEIRMGLENARRRLAVSEIIGNASRQAEFSR